MAMATNMDQILHDFPPLLRVYKDGRVERLTGLDFVPASVDPATGVQSKDVVIAPEIDLSARIFLPANADPSKKIPLLLYFHGGGFVAESAFSHQYHKHLNFLVAEANVVAVSVNYRLAPEHPLPIAFEDSWLSLKWVASQSTDAGHEKWIQDYADLGRVYLGGDSAGGNIAHNIAMRVGLEKLNGINLRGIFLNCPFFWGEDPILNEEKGVDMRSFTYKFLRYVCPSISSCDEPWINPATDEKLASLECGKVLVYVAEKDRLKDRGWYYKDSLTKSGWNGDVEVVEVKEEDHVFSVLCPDAENSLAMLKKVAAFINH
ncbi:putative carboxylesterase 2 [Sesamum alatum]|uniref:Carboxylesterase 2 n=1 Tax=Sesamum alatum TaxID=300844 RepID=A0AAE1YWG5_9LAMI|nr:putative carboxylesterase 2 [Sesamum alatum]